MDSGRKTVPSVASDSFMFGKLLQHCLGKDATLARFTRVSEIGVIEIRQLIDCLLVTDASKRWSMEHAVCHPSFWDHETVRLFIGLVLKYVGSTDSAFRRNSIRNGRSTTTKTLSKRRRRFELSRDLLVWVNQPVLWLNSVNDWFEAICRDNHEGIRYDYESSVEDQLTFFTNVYEHLKKHKTPTICGGDESAFALRFVHERFPGLLLSISIRVLQSKGDQERFLMLLDEEMQNRSLADLKAGNFLTFSDIHEVDLHSPFLGVTDESKQDSLPPNAPEKAFQTIERFLRRLAQDIGGST
jgi:hypothetical protein